MLDLSRLREIQIQNTVTTVSKFREHPTLLSFLPCYFSLIRLYVLFSSTEFVKAVGTERNGTGCLPCIFNPSLSLCASGKERKERPYNNKRFWFNFHCVARFLQQLLMTWQSVDRGARSNVWAHAGGGENNCTDVI
jgi:hypothetical protein